MWPCALSRTARPWPLPAAHPVREGFPVIKKIAYLDISRRFIDEGGHARPLRHYLVEEHLHQLIVPTMAAFTAAA